MASGGYVGRFAPSPTGPLHFGSLVAAAGSYLQARRERGQWLVRIEDIDPPREVPGASADILRTLERLGFEWDGEVIYQSRRIDHYRARLREIAAQTFWCRCSRKDIAQTNAAAASPAGRYPGTCRDLGLCEGALRVRCDALPAFYDEIQGRFTPEPGPDDYVVWRREDLPSYQWAVTVDDAEQGITQVVRGADLLETTPRQIDLLQRLDAPVPSFMHLPVVVNDRGQKLSKQTGATALPAADTGATLCAAFGALGLSPPPALRTESSAQIWHWAIAAWNPNALKNIGTIAFVDE